MENFHIIIVKYLPCTNFKGSRCKLISERFGDSVTFSYNYSHNNVVDMAKEWLTERGQDIVGQGEGKKHHYIILRAQDNGFTPLKEMD